MACCGAPGVRMVYEVSMKSGETFRVNSEIEARSLILQNGGQGTWRLVPAS